MSWTRIIFNDEPGKNVDHILANDLSLDDVVNALTDPQHFGISRTTGREMLFGYSLDGRYIGIPYEEIDEDSVYPVTAFCCKEPRS